MSKNKGRGTEEKWGWGDRRVREEERKERFAKLSTW